MGSDARACSEILRATAVTNAFGMTETSAVTQIYAWKEGACRDSEPFPVGRMAPGAKARICAPNSREPMKRGEIGELHLRGATIINGYIGGNDDNSRFYADGDGSWYIAGDRAIMASSGDIKALGRYKDIINRPGENMSPSIIERVLNQVVGVKSSQVVGVPDEVAGEVPVAVIKMVDNSNVPKEILYDRVVKELGVSFALERAIALGELGINDFPTTAIGKVRKVELQELALKYLPDEFNKATQMTAKEPTKAALTRLWAPFSSVPQKQISPTMSLEGMVDSVTVMRFRSHVKKELGKTLSLEELNRNPTIVQQAAILDRQQENILQESNTNAVPVREGPPSLDEIVHTHGRQCIFDDIRMQAERKLRALALSWDRDVENVLPIYDFLQYWRAQNRSMIFRIVFSCADVTIQQLRQKLEIVLSRHGPLRSVLIDSEAAGPSRMTICASTK